MRFTFVLFFGIWAPILAKYGDKYPISASLFADRYTKSEWNDTINSFMEMGGDTLIMTGAHFEYVHPSDIQTDKHFMNCVSDSKTCVDEAEEELATARNLSIQAWFTYSHEDNFSGKLMACDKLDKRIKHNGEVFYRLVLWMEEYTPATDCNFKPGSKVGVVFTSFNKGHDSSEIMLELASRNNMTAYLGYPKPFYLDETQESADRILVYYAFVYRILQDAQSRYKNYTAMKGFYSSERLVPSYMLNPPTKRPEGQAIPSNYSLLFWREIGLLAGYFQFTMVVSLDVDLTRAGNTSIANHTKALQSLRLLCPASAFLIREGRGDGQAAYFSQTQKNQKIFDLDMELWNILRKTNTSLSQDITFTDIFYASISDFYSMIRSAKYTSDMPVWLAVEAYDDLPWRPCQPVGKEKPVMRTNKKRLDRSLTAAGSLVQKIAAYSWDPEFLCTDVHHSKDLADEVKADYRRPIISDCDFVRHGNHTVVAIGYNLDKPDLSFKVVHRNARGELVTAGVKACQIDTEYGKKNQRVKELVYAQLCDLPKPDDLEPAGYMTVQPDGAYYNCEFYYLNPDDEMFGF